VRGIQAQQQREDFVGGMTIKVAGRLVGEDAGWLRHQRTGQRRALALSAGEFAGAMLQPRAEPDLGENRRRLPFRCRLVHAPDQQRHRDVLQRGEFRQQVVELIDEAERFVAQAAPFAFRHSGEIIAEQMHAAGSGRVEPAKQMQQCALARAARADDGCRLASADFQIDARQHRHFRRALAEYLAQASAGKHCVIHT